MFDLSVNLFCDIENYVDRTRFAELAGDWLLTSNVERWLGGPDFQTNEDRLT